MRFLTYFRAFSYAMIGVAMLALVLARGLDYSDVSPIRGVILGGGQHTLQVSVDVVRASA